MSKEETVPITIDIPRGLSEKVNERMKKMGFTSIQQYIVHVLQQVVAEEEQEVYTKEEEEKIKERLRAMGYL
jgi:metal-responsive CopG/Arc/MetJ family transcriptional regulator